MAKHRNVVRISEVPPEEMKVPEGSSFGGKRQRVGLAIGARKLGYSFFTAPPGKAAFPFHLHNGNEEMIFIRTIPTNSSIPPTGHSATSWRARWNIPRSPNIPTQTRSAPT